MMERMTGKAAVTALEQWQSKTYRFPSRGAVYLHDQGHHHACFKCPERPMPTKRIPLVVIKVLEPRTGR